VYLPWISCTCLQPSVFRRSISTLNMNTLRSLFGKPTQPSKPDEDTQSDNNNGFPVPNHTLSYWRSELHPIDSYCSSEDLPSSCDIAIIGAGITGVSTAYHLSRLHSANPTAQKPSIVILDAREVCSGATGRNGVSLANPQILQTPKLISSIGSFKDPSLHNAQYTQRTRFRSSKLPR
jgi:hypothetical protein